jgi:hypothetical protein
MRKGRKPKKTEKEKKTMKAMFALNEERKQIIRRRTTMKRLSHSFKLLMMTMLFVGITLAAAGTASAEWYVIHGVIGQVENESVLESVRRIRQGLDCKFKPGDKNKETWVHFAVPSLKGKGAVRHIRVLYYDWGTEVTGLEVYNGGGRKLQIPGDRPIDANWNTSDKAWRWLKLDLTDAPIDSQNGIGISVKVKSRDTDQRRFRFSSAQALFDEDKTY